jgi:hypothetical protein
VTKIQRRAGHDEIAMTLGYVKMAEDLSGAIGEPFPPLPRSLLPAPSSPPNPSPKAAREGNWPNNWPKLDKRAKKPGKSAERAGFEPAAGF